MTSAATAAALCAARAWYDAHISQLPRSEEWKHGARAGCWKAHGLQHSSSLWPTGTAQDDARNAGFRYGYEQARHDLKAGAAA